MKLIGWTDFDSDCQGIEINDRESMIGALNELVNVIREKEYVFSGEAHQAKNCCVPVFDNGKCLRCSMRRWAMIMAFAYTESEESYMDYYMDFSIPNEKTPEDEAPEDAFVKDELKGLPFYYANQDIELVLQSAQAGMQVMSFDKVVLLLYDIISQQLQEEDEEE